MSQAVCHENDVTIAITAASYSGNKGAAAMLQSSIKQLLERYGSGLNIKLMSVYPAKDKEQIPFDFIDVVSAPPRNCCLPLFLSLSCISYLNASSLFASFSRKIKLSKRIHKQML